MGKKEKKMNDLLIWIFILSFFFYVRGIIKSTLVLLGFGDAGGVGLVRIPGEHLHAVDADIASEPAAGPRVLVGLGLLDGGAAVLTLENNHDLNFFV